MRLELTKRSSRSAAFKAAPRPYWGQLRHINIIQTYIKVRWTFIKEAPITLLSILCIGLDTTSQKLTYIIAIGYLYNHTFYSINSQSIVDQIVFEIYFPF